LKGGKETSDLAEYFPPFETQIGPKIKKMASDYFSASLLRPNRFEARLSKRVDPYQFAKTGAKRA